MKRFRFNPARTVPQLIRDLQDTNRDVDKIIKAARREHGSRGGGGGGGSAVKVITILAIVTLLIVINLCAFSANDMFLGVGASVVILVFCAVFAFAADGL